MNQTREPGVQSRIIILPVHCLLHVSEARKGFNTPEHLPCAPDESELTHVLPGLTTSERQWPRSGMQSYLKMHTSYHFDRVNQLNSTALEIV